MTGLGAQLGRHRIDPESVQRLSLGFCRKKNVVILGRLDPESTAPVTVGMLDVEDRDLRQRLQRFLNRTIEAISLTHAQIDRALDLGFGTWKHGSADAAVRLRSPDDLTDEGEREALAVLEEIVGTAIANTASAIHIERTHDDVTVRMRIDSRLVGHASPLSVDNVDAVLRQIVALVGLDAADSARATPTSGTTTVELNSDGASRVVGLRVSLLGSGSQAEVVMLLHDSARAVVPLADLSMSPSQRALIDRMLFGPSGLLLVGGDDPDHTQQTALALLEPFDSHGRKLVTLEDRVRYQVPGVRHHGLSADVDPAAMLVGLLDHDPDVLLVDTTLTRPVLNAVMAAVRRGVRVLATTWARDTVDALTTLDLNGPTIATMLRGVIVQRAMRGLCTQCRAPAGTDADDAEIFAHSDGPWPHWNAPGCEQCDGVGYASTFRVFELSPLPRSVSDALASNASAATLRQVLNATEMQPVREVAVGAARQGQTDLIELRRAFDWSDG